MKARKTTRLSFLEILLEMSAEAQHAVDGILDAVGYHQKHSVSRMWLSREEVLKGGLLRVCANAPLTAPLAFLSKVKTGSSSFSHIPLLDLHESVPNEFFFDTVHLNERGHARIAPLIRSFVTSVMADRARVEAPAEPRLPSSS